MDLFDLTNVDDLPDKVKEGINIDMMATRILDLFELAQRDLSLDELTVAYYRKYKDEDTEIRSKRQIMGKVYNMSRERNPKIKSVEGKKEFTLFVRKILKMNREIDKLRQENGVSLSCLGFVKQPKLFHKATFMIYTQVI